MKKKIYLFFCLTIAACHSNTKENTKMDTTKNSDTTSVNSGPFDLAKLTLNENLEVLTNNLGIKPEAKEENDVTMLGFEVFKSSSSKVLRFENFDLSGQRGKSKNSVLFHQNDKKVLAGYELTLYNQQQTDTLISLTSKVATLVFKQTHMPKGAIELDENGNEVKNNDSVRKTYRVWENKKSGLSYFLTENGLGKNLVSKLIVLNRSTPFGKDWISTLQLDWYKNEKSESF
ncbi:hypothetical protein ACXZ1K_17360 [Pedobacter sp. PWIIR3]